LKIKVLTFEAEVLLDDLMLVLLKAHTNGFFFLIGSEDVLGWRDLLIVLLVTWEDT
jgi:hypothetical protein